jgi:hypothetical protein
MMTLEERLETIASLLPAAAQERFTAPLNPGESVDTRLADAVRALAKSEGLVCMTPGEFTRAANQHATQRALPPEPAADGKPEPDLAARFATITDPRAQTAFWRSLTAEQRAAILETK